MQTILKNNAFFVPGQLPVHLYYTVFSGDLGFHSHEFTEIAVMLNGSAVYETDFSSETISAGDVLIIPRGGLHRYCDEKDVQLINILFHFDQLNIPVHNICRHPGYVALFGIDPGYYREKEFYPKLHLAEEKLAHLRSILLSAYQLQKNKAPGYLLAVYGAFLQTIPVLLENFAPEHKARTLPLPEKFHQTLNYMLKNYQYDLPITELAKKAGMSQSTFARTFKKALGKTPRQYLLMHRLEAAREFLRNGASVSEAAVKAGFKDSNYFTRLFHKHLHCLPKSWKQN